MKTIKLLFVALLAVAMTACGEDKVYEGPNTIEAVSINPDAPTSFDDVVVTAKVSGLLDVTKAVLRYSVNDNFIEELDMDGNGNTYTEAYSRSYAEADFCAHIYAYTISDARAFRSDRFPGWYGSHPDIFR